VAETPGLAEDFCRLADGTILMGKENRLFAWSPRPGSDWKEIAELSPMGIAHITRLAVSPDGRRLVVVHERKTP
jgi:hypothetical protein